MGGFTFYSQNMSQPLKEVMNASNRPERDGQSLKKADFQQTVQIVASHDLPFVVRSHFSE